MQKMMKVYTICLLVFLIAAGTAQAQKRRQLTPLERRALHISVAKKLDDAQRLAFRKLDCEGRVFTLSQVEPDPAKRALLTGGLVDDLPFRGDKNREVCIEIAKLKEQIVQVVEEAVVPVEEIEKIDVDVKKVEEEIKAFKDEMLLEKREYPAWIRDAVNTVETHLKQVDVKNKSMGYLNHDESFRIALFNLEYQMKAYRGIYKEKSKDLEKAEEKLAEKTGVAGKKEGGKKGGKKGKDKENKEEEVAKKEDEVKVGEIDEKKKKERAPDFETALKNGLYPASDDLYERVKELEDAFSHRVSDKDFYKLLCDGKWVDTTVNKDILSDVKNFTSVLKFNSEREERQAIMYSIGRWIKGVHDKVANTIEEKGKEEDRYDFSKQEEGVHEFRRDVRGFYYFRRAFPNFFTSDSNHCPLNGGKYQPGVLNENGQCVLSDCLVYEADHTQGSVWAVFRQGDGGGSVKKLAKNLYENRALELLSRQIKECGGRALDADEKKAEKKAEKESKK